MHTYMHMHTLVHIHKIDQIMYVYVFIYTYEQEGSLVSAELTATLICEAITAHIREKKTSTRCVSTH